MRSPAISELPNAEMTVGVGVVGGGEGRASSESKKGPSAVRAQRSSEGRTQGFSIAGARVPSFSPSWCNRSARGEGAGRVRPMGAGGGGALGGGARASRAGGALGGGGRAV